jgi:hypothetical protein
MVVMLESALFIVVLAATLMCLISGAKSWRSADGSGRSLFLTTMAAAVPVLTAWSLVTAAVTYQLGMAGAPMELPYVALLANMAAAPLALLGGILLASQRHPTSHLLFAGSASLAAAGWGWISSALLPMA